MGVHKLHQTIGNVQKIKAAAAIELLPVKRTVKNQKILATSNRNVAGCFFVESGHCFTESAMKDESQAMPETINIFPRRRAASKRVSSYQDSSHAPRGSLLITGTPAGAGKDFPSHYVKCCPAVGQLSLDSVPAPCVCRNVMLSRT